MEFIQRYNQNKDKLTKSENKLANYIATHTEHVIYDTIKSLGTATNTGDATIVRLCKKLGYSGFSDLKIALAQDSMIKKKRHSTMRWKTYRYFERSSREITTLQGL